MKYVVCIDPEFSSSITVSDVRQRSATVSWSLTPSQTISSTVVRYQAASSSRWNPIDVSVTSNSHTVTGLQSGTEYRFQVIVTSHGKSSSSNTVEATTGKMSRGIAFSCQASSLCSIQDICVPTDSSLMTSDTRG